MPKTCVVNSETENFDVYIGRGSKWGNPYTHLPLAQTKAWTLIPYPAGRKLKADELQEIAAYLGVEPNEVRNLASDGPRYRAIGNSMAVPVMRWIGRRIQLAEDALRRSVGVMERVPRYRRKGGR